MDNTVGRQFFISQSQEEIINGSLLGDGRLECRSQKGSARFRVHHGWKQKNLVFWKYEVLKNLVSCPPKKIVCWKNPKNDQDYHSWYFHTRTLLELKEFYERFYPGEGEKALPEEIGTILTPLSLAVWYMDDGSCYKKGVTLNTHNFSKVENKILKEIFKKKFNLDCDLNRDRDKWRLRFHKSSFGKFCDLIKPYIIPSMEYKLSP